MGSEIRKLNAEEMKEFVKIVINAYPGMMKNTEEFKERLLNNLNNLHENEESVDFFGLFRNGKLLGGMRVHYFSMNLFSNIIHVGGVGLVAVDLLHKKEKVAKEMIEYFIRFFQEQGSSFVMLYPFRPDFYKKMGFGFGPKMNQYEVTPISFPATENKDGIVFLTADHKELVKDCYNQYAQLTHGMVLKTEHDMNVMFRNPEHKIVGYVENEVLKGYVVFSFEKGSESNFLLNNILVKEFIYSNPTSLLKISTFLHSQADQIQRVIINTMDNSLEYFLHDSRNTSSHLIPSVYHETNISGIGLMYRIIDINQFISELSGKYFEGNYTFTLHINDSFLADLPLKKSLQIEEGRLSIVEQTDRQPDFEIEIDIADLSSLLMGSIDVNALYNYGRLHISNQEYLVPLSKTFNGLHKPVCMTAF